MAKSSLSMQFDPDGIDIEQRMDRFIALGVCHRTKSN